MPSLNSKKHLGAELPNLALALILHCKLTALCKTLISPSRKEKPCLDLIFLLQIVWHWTEHMFGCIRFTCSRNYLSSISAEFKEQFT